MIVAGVVAFLADDAVGVAVTNVYPSFVENVSSSSQAVTVYRVARAVNVVAHTVVSVGLNIVVQVPVAVGTDPEEFWNREFDDPEKAPEAREYPATVVSSHSVNCGR